MISCPAASESAIAGRDGSRSAANANAKSHDIRRDRASQWDSASECFGFSGSILLLRQLHDLDRLAHTGHETQSEQNQAQPGLRPELLVEEFPEQESDDGRQRENE